MPDLLPPDNSPQDLDLRVIGRTVWRRRGWIIVPTAAAALISFVVVNTMTPKYKSEARIIVDGRENVFLRPNAESREVNSTLDAEAVTSQVQLILSRNLAREVIKKNGLDELPEFDSVLRGFSPLRTVLSLIGIGRDPLGLAAEERVLNAYFERLTAYAVDKSRVIAIEFQSSDPDLAARVANSITQSYLVLQQAARQDQARSAGQWLSGEIDALRTKVADAESRVEEFRSKSNLFVGLNNTTLSNQQLGEISTQLNAARAQKSDADSKARLIRGMLQSGRPIEASEVLNSELVRRLNEQRVTLSAQLAEQSSTLLGGHPRIKELRAQIADLDRQLREEAGKIVRSLENDAKIASGRLDSLTASLDQLKRQASSTNSQDVELRALEREAKAQRDLLESYLAKYREATTRESLESTPAEARIISRAVVSNTPASPKKLAIVLISTLAALLLSTGLITTGELLRMTAPPSAPRRVAPRPLAGAVRRQAAASSDIATFAREVSVAGEAARRIAVIAITSRVAAAPTALALARLLARDARVVVVDLAFADGALAAVSIDPQAPGLADLVAGKASFGDIITRDRSSQAHIVAAGHSPDATALQSPRIAMALDALARVYDHVLIDAGPLADMSDMIGAMGAHAVLVADPALPESALATARDRLTGAGFLDVTVLGPTAQGHAGVGARMAAA